jgi:hypothetical protein
MKSDKSEVSLDQFRDLEEQMLSLEANAALVEMAWTNVLPGTDMGVLDSRYGGAIRRCEVMTAALDNLLFAARGLVDNYRMTLKASLKRS